MKKVINKNLSKSHHCKKVSPAKIKSILTLFKYLIDQKKENKEIALQFLHDDGINYISELIYNLLYNESLNNSFKAHTRRKLVKVIKPHSSKFEVISKKHLPIKIQRSKIHQVGPGIGVILASVLPLLGSLLLSKK